MADSSKNFRTLRPFPIIAAHREVIEIIDGVRSGCVSVEEAMPPLRETMASILGRASH